MYAQDLKPFSEARKATTAFKNKGKVLDSLKRCYDNRVTIDFIFGQRFISETNQTNQPDTLTLTDFTEKKGFFGLGVGYFLTDQIMIGGMINFLILPKEQDITTFSGSSGSGSGSGGLSINFELLGRYYFNVKEHTRPYISVGLGNYQLIAKGGNIDFSASSGQNADINERNEQVRSTTLSSGISHRFTPGSMIDFNVAYSFTNRTVPIGGIVSPGGINSSLSLRFILNSQKNK